MAEGCEGVTGSEGEEMDGLFTEYRLGQTQAR